jgi:hypothetical protein
MEKLLEEASNRWAGQKCRQWPAPALSVRPSLIEEKRKFVKQIAENPNGSIKTRKPRKINPHTPQVAHFPYPTYRTNSS